MLVLPTSVLGLCGWQERQSPTVRSDNDDALTWCAGLVDGGEFVASIDGGTWPSASMLLALPRNRREVASRRSDRPGMPNQVRARAHGMVLGLKVSRGRTHPPSRCGGAQTALLEGHRRIVSPLARADELVLDDSR
jgi:hypothetical protein